MLAYAPLLAVAVIALVALALRAGQERQRRALLGVVVAGRVEGPTILFFSGAACTICHTAQRPALERLTATLDGRVGVREIDVAEEPGLAREFKVMSLPTTVVLDGEGRARAVNVGFASTQLLRSQLVDAGLLASAEPIAV
jgi:thioredoxin-like negative regulator of GroEL